MLMALLKLGNLAAREGHRENFLVKEKAMQSISIPSTQVYAYGHLKMYTYLYKHEKSFTVISNLACVKCFLLEKILKKQFILSITIGLFKKIYTLLILS